MESPEADPETVEDEVLYEHADDDEDVENAFFNELTVLCSERLNQMTKTYDDLEAVTKLLEEKEKDLELAAKIGKSLLERNKELQQTNDFLEEQFNYANDQVTQLKHELQQKIDLLQFFSENEAADSGGSTPSNERFSNWGLLQRKLRILEEENVTLKLEANHLKTLTQGLEEKEQQLLSDCVKQIGDSNGQIGVLSKELVQKEEQCESQLKQVNHLLKELADKSNSEKIARYENEDLIIRLRAAQETQAELAQELLDLQERYAEVVAMLTEAREELKLTRDKALARYLNSYAADDSLYDSLASELEASDSGYSGAERLSFYGMQNEAKNESLRRRNEDNLIKVMETVRSSLHKQEEAEAAERRQKEICAESVSFTSPLVVTVSENDRYSTPCTLEQHSWQPGHVADTSSSCHSTDDAPYGRAKEIMQQVESTLSDGRLSHATSNESLCSYPAPGLGVPGIPGSKDLEFAIRRLSLRRRIELEYERYRGSKNLIAPTIVRRSVSREPTPVDNRQSTASTQQASGSSRKYSSSLAPSLTCRSKLQLVKPVEGSNILAHWKDLATPGGIDSSSWEKRPGIKVKGGSGGSPPGTSKEEFPKSVFQKTGAQCSTTPSQPLRIGHRFPSTPPTFSYVTSRILHPSDDSKKVVTAAVSTCNILDALSVSPCSSLASSPPNTARSDDGTSTYSTALNLAQALGERCADLMTGLGGWLASRSSPMTVSTEWSNGTVAQNQIDTSAVKPMVRLVTPMTVEKREKSPSDGLASLVQNSADEKRVQHCETRSEKAESGGGGVVTRLALKPVIK